MDQNDRSSDQVARKLGTAIEHIAKQTRRPLQSYQLMIASHVDGLQPKDAVLLML